MLHPERRPPDAALSGPRTEGGSVNAGTVDRVNTSISGPRRWWWLLAVIPALRWMIIRYAVPVSHPPRSRCDTCAATLVPAGGAWRAISPIGRCGGCGSRLGALAFTVEISAAIAVVAAVRASPQALVAAAALWWVLCAVPMMFVDLRVHRLPNPLTYGAAAGVFVLLTLAAATGGHWSDLVSALLSAAVAGIVFLAVAMILGARGMGLGDAKLAVSVAGLTGWWGWGTAFGVILLAFFASGLLGVALLATRRADRHSQIPLGPSFIVATIAMLAFAAA